MADKIVAEQCKENIKDMLFGLAKLQILTTKLNLQTQSYISDDYAYAWYEGVYPFFDHDSEFVSLYSDYFEIKESDVEKVITYLDDEWQKPKYHTFTDIEKHFKDTVSRLHLIEILRYVFLHGSFDDKFWATLLSDKNCPIEAKSITSEFNIAGIRLY